MQVDVRDVGSILSQEDPLEEGMATHSNILTCRIPWQAAVHGVTKSQTQLKQFSTHICLKPWGT